MAETSVWAAHDISELLGLVKESYNSRHHKWKMVSFVEIVTK